MHCSELAQRRGGPSMGAVPGGLAASMPRNKALQTKWSPAISDCDAHRAILPHESSHRDCLPVMIKPGAMRPPGFARPARLKSVSNAEAVRWLAVPGHHQAACKCAFSLTTRCTAVRSPWVICRPAHQQAVSGTVPCYRQHGLSCSPPQLHPDITITAY